MNLPEGVEPEDLDPEPQPVQLQQAQGAQGTPQGTQRTPQDMQQDAANMDAQRANEARKFLRWAKGKRTPDVTKFASDVLDDGDKWALLLEAQDTRHTGWVERIQGHAVSARPRRR